MRRRGLSREALALLPWLFAALVWFAVVAPMRADLGDRLAEQSRVRKDRLRSEQAMREINGLRARMDAALRSSCLASPDPASLRRSAIGATSGLSLSPFSLSVTGGQDGGATIEAGGSQSALLGLLRRLGDPARGGFLRSATVRDRSGRWWVSATTGVLASLPAALLPAAARCPGVPDAGERPPAPAKVTASPRGRPGRPPIPSGPAPPSPVMSTPEPPEAPPFALVAFLLSGGKSRVSLRVGDEVRVISVGDQVEGWSCLSIDRDEGAVFTSADGVRVVLFARPPDR